MQKLLEQASIDNISFWVDEDNDIELSYEDKEPDEAFVAWLKREKTELLAYLAENKVYSEEAFEALLDKEGIRQSRSESVGSPKTSSVQAIYPATSLQQGFIFHYLSQPKDDAYRVQLILDFHHALDVQKYIKAWRLASIKFPMLRTAFDWDGEGEILQVVSSQPSIDDSNFKLIDISHLDEASREKAIKEIQESDRLEGFDLSQPGIIRFQIIKQSEALYSVLKTEHHSIADGWSGSVLLQTVHGLYAALLEGEETGAAEPVIEEERAYLETQEYYARQRSATDKYWQDAKKRFSDPNDLNALFSQPCDLQKLKVIEHSDEVLLKIGEPLVSELKSRCRELGITLSAATQFAWHKLIQLYTGDEQTLVGTTVSGRDIPVMGIEQSVGLYINTLPMALDWLDQDSIADVLAKIQEQSALLNTYSNVALVNLQNQGERLFHSLFVFENYPVSDSMELAGGNIELRQSVEKLDYPLVLMAFDRGDHLLLQLKYAADYISLKQANRLVEQIERVLACVAKNAALPHKTVSVVNDDERQQLLYSNNNTHVDYNLETTLHALFEQQVQRTPNATALIFNDQSLSYSDLNARANKLAQFILAQGIVKDDLVVVHAERSLEMVVALYAVIKAGAAYVPVDPSLPEGRISDILEDAKPKVVLSQQHLSNSLTRLLSDIENPPALFNLDADWQLLSDYSFKQEDLDKEIKHRIGAHDPSQLAYVIYTSGSTGKPKGVMNEHKGVVNRLLWMQDAYKINQSDKILQKTPFGFDVSVWEFFWPLQQGACLVIAKPDGHKDPAYLQQLIEEQGITVLHFVPSMLEMFLEHSEKNPNTSLQQIMCSGEALPSTTAQTCLDKFPKTRLHNLYGPTEAAIDVSFWECLKEHGDAPVPIGKPISNISLYVLDELLKPVPEGMRGEIYIGGVGVARGYLNREDLTQDRFIASPFNANERLYKTGDVGCWLPDGSIRYLGRNDFQVKIRGLRIELGEIENALNRLAQVKHCAVINRSRDGNAYLAAYLVLEDGQTFNEKNLRDALKGVLPEYMVPSTFTELDEIPVSINGKLDRKALPEPDFADTVSYVSPRNELEQSICEIWQSVLRVESIGIEDDFFRIGGNSILAIQLTSAIRNQLDIDVPLAVLLEEKTIKGIAGKFQQVVHIPKFDSKDVPMSFAQERMLFIERFEQGSTAYHIPYFVQLKDDTNLPALARAIEFIVDRHTILKTVYKQDEQGNDYQQIVDCPINLEPKLITVESDFEKSVVTDITRPFDLSNDASIRVNSYRFNEQNYLLIVWHHIAFDGWSTGVFLQELSAAYQALCEQKAAVLPELSITYADYAAWQKAELSGELAVTQTRYWQEKLAGYENLSLPTDFPRPVSAELEGRNYYFELDETLSDQLRAFARQNSTTLFSVTLAGFFIALAKLSGQKDVLLGTPTDNRHHAQTQGLIGLFVNSLALRADVNPDITMNDFVAQVHDTVIKAKANQDLPFERLVEALKVERDTSRHPLFQVMFSMDMEDPMSDMLEGLPFIPSEFANGSEAYSPAKFDLDLTLVDAKANIKGTFNYAVSLFKEDTVARYANMFIRALTELVSQGVSIVADAELLSDGERQQILVKFNRTESDYPRSATLNRLFAEHVVATPTKTAVVFEGKSLTYEQLDQRSTELATAIRANYSEQNGREMPADSLIALYLDRGLDVAVSILGVLKAGAAYVPISPEYPADRVQFILEDTQAPILISQTKHRTFVTDLLADSGLKQKPLYIDQIEASPQSTQKVTPVNVDADDLGYVIYTSGTTGKPKGVMIEHGAIVSRYFGWRDLYLNSETQVFLNMADYGFDVATGDWVRALCSGGTLVFCSKATLLDPNELSDLIKNQNVNFAEFVPAVLRNLIQFIKAKNLALDSLKKVAVGGDAWSLADHSEAQTVLGKSVELYNTYGLTECAVDSTWSKPDVEKLQASGTSIIGRPMSNVHAYVMNERLQPQPIGTPGELFIGGAGLARGYLNRPELTESRFILNPFASSDDWEKGYTRLYKTGDLVRWLENGELEYLGRNDFQVKIRGYRIELGEIEQALQKQAVIKQAVVIDNDKEGHKYLSAYIIPADQSSIDIEALRDELSSVLPDYMVPSTFTELKEIPLTVNGKVDRRQLPKPEWNIEDNYLAPSNEIEQALCEICQEILGLERVGVKDNFFRIGGDSIMSLRLVSQANALGIGISTRMVFEYSTLQKLAASAKRISVWNGDEPCSGVADLLPIHQDFYYAAHSQIQNAESQSSGRSWWKKLAGSNENSSVTSLSQFLELRLTYAPAGLEESDLKQIITKLIARHDVLRLRFTENQEGLHGEFQEFSESLCENTTKIYQLNAQSQMGFANELQWIYEKEAQSIDLENGPVFKAILLMGLAGQKAKVLWLAHKLIVDDSSWEILQNDAAVLFEQANADLNNADAGNEGIREKLPEKTASYQSFTKHIQSLGLNSKAEEDALQSSNKLAKFKQIISVLSDGATIALETKANATYQTEVKDLLLSALLLAAKRWRDSSEVSLVVEDDSRPVIEHELPLSQTLGYLAHSYPCNLSFDFNDRVDANAELIKSIKTQVSQVEENAFEYDKNTRPSERLVKKAGAMAFSYSAPTKSNENYQSHQVIDTNSFAETGDVIRLNTACYSHCGTDLSFELRMQAGILRINLSYNESAFSQKEAQKLSDFYLKALNEVIEHCEVQSSPYYVRDLPRSIYQLGIREEQKTGENNTDSEHASQELSEGAGGQNEAAFESLVRFNKDGKATALYCLPPSGAGGECYFRLAKKVDSDTPVTICENIEVYTDAIYSLPSLANYYANLIKSDNPTGEVKLLGASHGAILCHDVALRLEALGIKVSKVFFIDPIGYTMEAEVFDTILADERTTKFNQKDKAQLNASLHQFDYTKNLEPFEGEGVVFQSSGLTSRKEDWNAAEELVFDHFNFFENKNPEPQVSYGLDRFFNNCKAVHLVGDHGQMFDSKNLALIVAEINA